MRRPIFLLICTLAAAFSACAPAARAPVAPDATNAPPTLAQEERALRITLRNEPFDLTDSASSRNNVTLVLFGARLGQTDDADSPYPVLAEAVPQLNTDTWRVFEDGKMETTYRLRPNLRWHDDSPLTAEDVAFTHRADTESLQLGIRESAISPLEHRAIEEVLATDSRTVVFRWKQVYKDAAAPAMKVLPRHILEPIVSQGDGEGLGSHSYWTTGYVGAGPFRIAKWEPNAFIEAGAFDGFALGRPKIDRVVISWNADPSTTLARLLARDVDVALDGAIFYPQAAVLRKEWGSTDGVILIRAGTLRFLSPQHREAYASPASVLDVRVRRATAHAIDRQALSEALTEGYGPAAELPAAPGVRYFAALERVAPRYPYDLRRTEQLMAEAGFSRGPEGIYVGVEGQHSPELMGVAEGLEAQETTIIADYLKQAGIDAQLRLVPQAQLQQFDEMKSLYPAWRTNYGYGAPKDLSAGRMLGARASKAENRWGGTNKMGFDNPEHDQLYARWIQTLDVAEADRILVQIGRMHMEELPYIPNYFSPEVIAHARSLNGPTVGFGTSWHNIHEWSWK